MRCDYGLVIGHAAAHYGVSVVTMRRWEREKRLLPTSRTLGGHRRYRLDGDDDRFSVGYASGYPAAIRKRTWPDKKIFFHHTVTKLLAMWVPG